MHAWAGMEILARDTHVARVGALSTSAMPVFARVLAAHVRPFWTAPPLAPFTLVSYLSHTSVRCLDLIQNTPADGPCSGLDKRVHVGHVGVGRMAVTPPH